MRSLSEEVFKKNRELENISLANNYLVGLKKEAFERFTKLKVVEVEPQNEVPIEWSREGIPQRFVLD